MNVLSLVSFLFTPWVWHFCLELILCWDAIVAGIQVSTFADMEGDETFDTSLLGHADEVVEERVADDDVIMIKGTKTNSAVRNYSFFMLNYYLFCCNASTLFQAYMTHIYMCQIRIPKKSVKY